MKGKKDEIKFSQLMKGLAGVFDSKGTLSPVKIELYFKALEDLSIDQIEWSVGQLMRERKYPSMPLPADISGNIPHAQLSNGLDAWLLVEKSLEGGPTPEDPVINKTVDGMGGFDRLSRIPYAELTWTQREFERRYQLLNQRRELLELPAPRKLHRIEAKNGPGK